MCMLCMAGSVNAGGVQRKGVCTWACAWCVEDAVDWGVFSVVVCAKSGAYQMIHAEC